MYRYWADRFGWPPDVVDRQPAALMRRLALVDQHVGAGIAHRQEMDAGNRSSLARHNSR